MLLASSSTALVTVPARVVAPAGTTGASFPVTTRPVTSPTEVAVTAVLNGITRTVTRRRLPPAPTPTVVSLAIEPPRLVGGTIATGTVTLSAPAPPGGRGVGLGSAIPTLVSVIETVIVPAGATRATFTLTTRPVTCPTPVAVCAAGGTVRTASLELLPPPPLASPAVASLSLTTSPVSGAESVRR